MGTSRKRTVDTGRTDSLNRPIYESDKSQQEPSTSSSQKREENISSGYESFSSEYNDQDVDNNDSSDEGRNEEDETMRRHMAEDMAIDRALRKARNKKRSRPSRSNSNGPVEKATRKIVDSFFPYLK